MKVKDLMEALADADPEADVILQADAEGNGYSPLQTADIDAVYVPDTTYSGHAYSLSYSAEDAGLTEEGWSEIKRKPRCVVLAPLN
jgi:hypothetical protein